MGVGAVAGAEHTQVLKGETARRRKEAEADPSMAKQPCVADRRVLAPLSAAASVHAHGSLVSWSTTTGAAFAFVLAIRIRARPLAS